MYREWCQGGGEADVIQKIHISRVSVVSSSCIIPSSLSPPPTSSSWLSQLGEPSEREILDVDASCIVRPNSIRVWMSPPLKDIDNDNDDDWHRHRSVDVESWIYELLAWGWIVFLRY